MILDVVYNHLGPDGNYLGAVLAATTSPTATRPSGATRSTSTAPTPGPVREFFVANAGYWIDEFHLDGLRLDATQAIFDDVAASTSSPRSAARAREARAGRATSSSSPRTSRRTRGWSARRAEGGYGLDALWNDDFHHTRDGRADRARARPTTPTTAARRRSSSRRRKYGFLYQGQRYSLAEEARAARRRSDLPPAAFVTFLAEPRPGRQLGARACACTRSTSPGRYRAMTALLLLGPRHADAVPGAGVRRVDARSSTSPTTTPELGRRWCARAGASSSRSSPASPTPDMQARAARPGRPRDVRALQARLGRARSARRRASRCTATCCALRRDDPAFARPGAARRRRRGARPPRRSCCASSAPARRRPPAARQPRRATCTSSPLPEPLLAPPAGTRWRVAVVERGPALRRRGHARRSNRTTDWRLPGRRRAVLLAPASDEP